MGKTAPEGANEVAIAPLISEPICGAGLEALLSLILSLIEGFAPRAGRLPPWPGGVGVAVLHRDSRWVS